MLRFSELMFECVVIIIITPKHYTYPLILYILHTTIFAASGDVQTIASG